MRAAGVVCLGLGLVVGLPVLVVVLVAGSGQAAAAPSSLGLGGDLRAGSVPAEYAPLVAAAGSVCVAAPAGVVAAQIEQESGWDPTAVSPAGAQGISQFMPGTWPHWSGPGESAFDPAAAIAAQGRYDCALAAQMRSAMDSGRLPQADVTSMMLAAYNAGPARVLAAGGIPQNGETPGYVARILSRAAFFAAAPDGGGAAAAGSFAAREIAAAQSQLGVPYAWGGGTYAGPTRGIHDGGVADAHGDFDKVGFDCSGLVMYAVYRASGGKILLPHSADAQGRGGTAVLPSAMRPGDLISFTNPGESVAHHIGIYTGDDQMIDAPESGTRVRIDSLATPYYRSQVWRVVRYG